MKAHDKLAVGRLRASRKSPYFQALFLSFVPIEMEGLGTVASTNKMLFLWDPEAIDRWPLDVIEFAWWHEAMHIMLQHANRLGNRDPKIWNFAGDLFINQQAREANFAVPDWALVPDKFGFDRNLTTEEYYDLLIEQAAEQEQGDGEGDSNGVMAGNCGSCSGNKRPEEPEGGKDAEGESLGERSEVEVQQTCRDAAESIAAESSKGRGFIPSGLQRFAEGLLEAPKVPWQTLLARATRNAIAYRPGAVDYRYSKMSRRQAAVGYGAGRPVLPALIAPVPRVALVLDTSGSMGSDDIAAGLSEAAGVLRAVGADIDFCACDAAVHALQKVRSVAELANLVKGGGGTHFHPAFEALARQKDKPEVIVFATDGGGSAPANPPAGSRVIWLLIGSHKCHPYFDGENEWGEFIELD